MAPAVTTEPAGTGQGHAAPALPVRPGIGRVHQASYPGVRESVGQARRHVAAALAEVPCADDVVYAVSEISTNAVVHSLSGLPEGEFSVAVDVFPGSLVIIAVTDQGGRWQDSGPDFYLHGLGIVREMAAAVWIGGGEDARTVRAVFGWEARG